MDKILMLVSSLLFALGTYYARILAINTGMSAAITSFTRFVMGAVFLGGYLMYNKQSFRPNNPKTILLRVSLNFGAILLSTLSLNYTSITNNNLLNMLYPVFVVLLAPLISKESIEKSTYIYLGLVMAGAYLITNPSFSSINLGDVFAFLSAVFTAFSIFALKDAMLYDDPNLIIFYAMIFGVIFNFPIAYNDLVNFEMAGLFTAILSGATGLLGMLAQTWSYKTLDSATGSLISTSRITMSAIIGYLLLSEPLDVRRILGIILVTIALIGVSGYFKPYYGEKEEE
ncbi:MAG: DMT family transporter [Tissierellia bacterium]|nr:DMT family transporter [Tissierellia bacterium]